MFQAILAYGRPTFSSEHPSGTLDSNLGLFSKPAFETTRYRNYEGTGTPYHRDDFDRFGSYDRSMAPFQRSEIDCYGNYDGSSSFQKGDFDQHSVHNDSNLHGRSPYSLGEMCPYQTPRSTGGFSRPVFESSSPFRRPYGCSPSTSSYGSYGGQIHDSGIPQFSRHSAMMDQNDRMPPQTLYGMFLFYWFLSLFHSFRWCFMPRS